MQASAVQATFDRLAPLYDGLWTESLIGQLQRSAVWRHVLPFVRAGQQVLELGCGTGADAEFLARLGLCVTATDISPQMISRTRARGVQSRVLAIEELDQVTEKFDLLLSNFGALNCVPDLDRFCRRIGHLIRPGGYAVLCFAGRFCLWESAWYGFHGRFRKAVRRWSGEDFSYSLGIRVCYPTAGSIQRALAPDFQLVRLAGIGICVPPSYVHSLPPRLLRAFDRIDRGVATLPVARSLSDHRLLIFRRS